MSQNEYNPPSLPAEKQISLQKRAKKPALVYDTDGKLLDLQSIAKSDDVIGVYRVSRDINTCCFSFSEIVIHFCDEQ